MENFLTLWVLVGVLLTVLSFVIWGFILFFKRENEEYEKKKRKWKNNLILSVLTVVFSFSVWIYVSKTGGEIDEEKIIKAIYLIIVLFSVKGFVAYRLFRKNKNIEEISNVSENNINGVGNINIIAEDFKIVGNEDKYFIKFENEKIQFLVENNEIVGIFIPEKSNRIDYY